MLLDKFTNNTFFEEIHGNCFISLSVKNPISTSDVRSWIKQILLRKNMDVSAFRSNIGIWL